MFDHVWIPGRASTTLVMLHGTGGDERSLLPLATTLDPEANVLSLRGRIDEGGMNRFFRRIAEGVFDEASIVAESKALSDFLAERALASGFSLASAYAVGFSNGANIAAATLLLHPGALAGGILMRPMVPLVPSAPPDLRGKRVLSINGRADPIVPVENANRLASMFSEFGANVEHVMLEAGHNLTREEIGLAQRWLAQIER